MVRRALDYLPTLMFSFALVSTHAALLSFANSCASVGPLVMQPIITAPHPLGKVHTTAVGPTWNRQSHRGSVVPHRNPVYAREGL